MPHAGALANFLVLTLARPLSLHTRFVHAKRFVERCRNGLPKTKAEQGWDRTTDHVRYAFLRFGIENKVIIKRLKASGFSVGKDAIIFWMAKSS